jgi:hypothetical protein
MTFERPDQPPGPDGDREHLFVPLADQQPELAERLLRRFAELWVVAARLRPPSIEDAMVTAELKVAQCLEFDGSCLRLRSFYTGTTYWQPGWDGSEAAALAFIEEMAELQGANVGEDRRHGPTLWDHVQRKP